MFVFRNFSRLNRISLLAALMAAQAFLSGCSSASTKANAQETKPAVAGSASTAAAQALPESAHTVKRGETTTLLARKYLTQSSMMTVAEFDAAIRDANHLGKSTALKPGSEITIPSLEKQPVVEKSRPVAKDADIRAVYLTGTMA